MLFSRFDQQLDIPSALDIYGQMLEDRLKEHMHTETKKLKLAREEQLAAITEMRRDLQTQINDLKGHFGEARAVVMSSRELCQNLEGSQAKQWAEVKDLANKLTVILKVVDQVDLDVKSLKTQHGSQVESSQVDPMQLRLDLSKVRSEQMQVQDSAQTRPADVSFSPSLFASPTDTHLMAEMGHAYQGVVPPNQNTKGAKEFIGTFTDAQAVKGNAYMEHAASNDLAFMDKCQANSNGARHLVVNGSSLAGPVDSTTPARQLDPSTQALTADQVRTVSTGPRHILQHKADNRFGPTERQHSPAMREDKFQLDVFQRCEGRAEPMSPSQKSFRNTINGALNRQRAQSPHTGVVHSISQSSLDLSRNSFDMQQAGQMQWPAIERVMQVANIPQDSPLAQNAMQQIRTRIMYRP